MVESLKLKNRSIPLTDNQVRALAASAKRISKVKGQRVTYTKRARDLIIDGLAREEVEARVA